MLDLIRADKVSLRGANTDITGLSTKHLRRRRSGVARELFGGWANTPLFMARKELMALQLGSPGWLPDTGRWIGCCRSRRGWNAFLIQAAM